MAWWKGYCEEVNMLDLGFHELLLRGKQYYV